MIKDIIDVLADPIDGTALTGNDDFTQLISESGHAYDVAPAGYITLAGDNGLRYSGADLSMITARETFLSHGHFAPFVEAVSTTIEDMFDDIGLPDDAQPVITEVGAGTGYYLSHVLDSVAGAVVADVWSRLPIRDASVDAIAVVFAPRNAAEFARILKPQGEVIVVTPNHGHLAELRRPLGIADIEEGKLDRMIAQAAEHLVPVADSTTIEFVMNLDQQSIATQIGMSPSARHIHPDILAERIATLPDTMQVTARASVTRLRRAHQDH